MPTVYRLAKRRYPVYDGSGAALEGARWNSPGRILIYASEHYATAILEKLVHAGRTQLPGAHRSSGTNRSGIRASNMSCQRAGSML